MGSRFHGDSNDPAVNVTTWLLMIAMFCSVATRLGTKLHLFKRLLVDDVLILVSFVFGIAQGVTVSLAVGQGYGDHEAKVSRERQDMAMKNLYAASLLYTLSIATSKLSLALFIRNLSPVQRDKSLAFSVVTVVGVWAVVVLFGTAFQCSLPDVWNIWHGKCFNLLAWRYFVVGSNVLTDLLIVGQAVVLVYGVQTSARRRLMFAAIFVPRLSVPIVAIYQLTTVSKATRSADPTYDMCILTIMDGVLQCLSIVSACWGQLKPFMSWMRSNGLKLGDDTTAWTYEMRSRRSTTKSKGKVDSKGSGLSLPIHRERILVTQEWDVNSQSSQVNIITESSDDWDNTNNHQTRAWTGGSL